MRYILTFIFLICFGIANSTVFYISPSGNNGNAGTIGSPWLTLTYAVAHVSSGDIVHVNAGTYLEAGQVFVGTGISIEGDGVTSILTTSLTASFNGFIAMLSAEGTNGSQHISNVKIDGRSLATPRGIDIEGRSNVSVHDCTISNFKEEGIIFNGAASFTSLPPGIYATGNTFHDNVLTNCSQFSGFGTGCLGVGGQLGMLIYNNTITQLLRSGSFIGWPIKYYNEGWNNGMKIYNNTITKAPFDGNGFDFAIELFNQSGMEIYGNIIQGTLDFNFQTKGSYAYSIYIHDNTVAQPTFNPHTEDGVIIEYGIEGLWVKNNIFRNLSTGVIFYTRQDATIKDIEIEANLFANFGQSSIGGSVGAFIGGFGVGADRYTIDIFHVYNNTFAGLSSNPPGSGIGLGDCNTGFIRNVDIRNNSFQYIVNDVFKVGGSITPTIFNFSYNNTKNITYNSSPTYSNIPTSYTSSPNFSFTPIFVNTIDYALAVGSPFIGAGQNVGYGLDLGYKQFNSVINPIANAGVDQTITLPTNSVTMAGSGTAGTYSIVSHVWTQVSGTTAIITTPTSYTTTITGLGTADTYTFRLIVTDSMGNTDHDDMIVTVTGSQLNKQYLISTKKFVNATQ